MDVRNMFREKDGYQCNLFKRRFRMTLEEYLIFLQIFRERDLFPLQDRQDGRGIPAAPLELLASFARLGGLKWAFIKDMTFISEKKQRKVFAQ